MKCHCWIAAAWGGGSWHATHASLLADGPASSSLQRTGSVTAVCCAQDDDTWIVATEFPTDVAPSALPAASITCSVPARDGLAGLMTIGAALSAQEDAVSQQHSLEHGTPCAQLRVVCTSAGTPAVHSTIVLPPQLRVPDLLSFQVRSQRIDVSWRLTRISSSEFVCCVQRSTARVLVGSSRHPASVHVYSLAPHVTEVGRIVRCV